MQSEIKQLSLALASEQQTTSLAVMEHDSGLEAASRPKAAFGTLLNSSNADIAKYKDLLHDCRAKNRALQINALRSQRARDKAQTKAKQAGQSAKVKQSWNLKKGGAYTPDDRAMARVLVKAGCSQGKVGSVGYSMLRRRQAYP
jgi:Skp family chaperone for outer membrane proteins